MCRVANLVGGISLQPLRCPPTVFICRNHCDGLRSILLLNLILRLRFSLDLQRVRSPADDLQGIPLRISQYLDIYRYLRQIVSAADAEPKRVLMKPLCLPLQFSQSVHLDFCRCTQGSVRLVRPELCLFDRSLLRCKV